MGESESNPKQLSDAVWGNVNTWLQFLLLLGALVTFALHAESRLSKIEQRLDDAERDRQTLVSQIDRIENRLLARVP